MSLHSLTGGQLLHALASFAYAPKTQTSLQGGPCQRGILKWVILMSLLRISQFGKLRECCIKASDEFSII